MNIQKSFAMVYIFNVFSLYRTEILEDAVNKFTVFKDKIPVFVEIAKDVSKFYGSFK